MRYVTIPNAMTALRVVLSPLLAQLIFAQNTFWALVIFTIALATDVDGSVASFLNQRTRFGEYFDPIADGILLACGIIPLLILGDVSWMLLLILLLVNVLRYVISYLHMKRAGTLGSTLWSKATGVATLLIIPLGILKWTHLDAYLWFVIIFTAIVLSQKLVAEIR